MAQYTNCADPSESAARKERLRQAEAQGLLEQNARRMARTAIVQENSVVSPLESHSEILRTQDPLQKRTPMSERLGPCNEDPPSSERVSIADRLGPLTGRPAGDEVQDLFSEKRRGPTESQSQLDLDMLICKMRKCPQTPWR
ncbi:zf-CCHC_4 domain-containing protein [Raphanus sativus]|nr:zf-CCHC_4 domain-containing protein [Raphanus sativus]